MSPDKKFMALKDMPPQPTVPPNCNFVMYKKVGKLLILSGYGPLRGPKIPPQYVGQLGKKVTTRQGADAARLTAINLLLVARSAIKSLDEVKEIISVEGFVNSTSTFTDQPTVINGCSDLLIEIFGKNGKHTRSAIGTNTLAFGICVEISMTIRLK